MGEPNWPNLPQMPPTQLLPKRRGQLAPTYAFARHLAIGVGMDGQRPCRTLAEDPGRTQPRAAYPRAAAQTRVVSLAGIRLRSWESARVFKGIICADVSEFESYMSSQTVRLCALLSGRGKRRRRAPHDGDARLMDRIELSPRSSVVQIPIGVWHDFVVLERNTAVLEIKPGPYVPNEFADWAPEEGDATATRFVKWITNAAPGDRWSLTQRAVRASRAIRDEVE